MNNVDTAIACLSSDISVIQERFYGASNISDTKEAAILMAAAALDLARAKRRGAQSHIALALCEQGQAAIWLCNT